MLIKDFLDDISQKGSGIKISTSEVIDKHKNEYIKSKSSITSDIFKVSGVYYAIVRIPSKTVKKFNYDAVVQFVELGPTIEESKIKIFSNSPSFIYNFAYVFYHMPDEGSTGMIIDGFHKKIPKDNLMIDLTEKKIGPEVLHQPPSIKNPYGIPYLDKSLYFAIFHLIDRYTPKSIKAKARYKNNRQLENEIMSFEKTMMLRTKIQQDATEKRIDKLRIQKDHKEMLKEGLREGQNVSIRYTKKRGMQATMRPSTAVNNIKKKTGKMNINKIKKMK